MLEQVRDRLAAASEMYHDDVILLRPLLRLEYESHVTGLQCLYPELSRLMRSNLTFAVAFTNCVLEAPTTEISRAIKDDLLRHVAQDMSTVSIDMRDDEVIDRQLATLDQGANVAESVKRPLVKLSSTGIGLFIKHLYGQGLFTSVESMLVQLVSEMDRALIVDLHKIYVPFLQELIGLMLVYGVPRTQVTYGSFFESVLHNYLHRFVGRKEDVKSVERQSWETRAKAALDSLESFDHSYFRDILGEKYDIVILPDLQKIQQCCQSHS